MESQPKLPLLDAVEQRVLGALMEKSRTTPDYYPLTVNSLLSACNQKTSRKPVVDYDENTVTTALNTLKKKGLVATVTGGSGRVLKYRHTFAVLFPLVPAEVSLICLLLLRGPQTPGELNTNSARMYEFESLEEINGILDKLSRGDDPFVVQLPRKAGQKELRYMHLLGGKDFAEEDASDNYNSNPSGPFEERISNLERQVAEMKENLDKLMKELM
jgi:uncharacterized protein YceH (UPF0502 family)